MLTHSLYSKEIVVVDDAFESLMILSEILKTHNFEIKSFDNGKDALEYIFRNPPTLILLDIMMPYMDGIEVCKELKKNPDTENIPVIFISALEDNGTKLKSFGAGGVDYIIKPFYKDEVVARVRAHYNLFCSQLELNDKNEKLQNEIKCRIKAEQSLVKFKMGFDNTDDAIYITDKSGAIEYVNPAFERIYGYSFSEISGQSPRILTQGILSDEEYEQHRANLLKNKLFKGEMPHKIKDGTIVYVENSKNPILNHQGEMMGCISVSRDVTRRKLDDEIIQKFSQIIEQSPSIIMITDVNGVIEYVNPQFTEVTGYAEEEVLGKKPSILKSGMMDEQVYKNLWETISSGKVWRGELVNRSKTGELLWDWAIIAPLRNNDEEITNYIATKEDIGRKKKMEADLIAAKEKAEENDRLKSAFLANMSHEIRTPLNSIIGFSEMITDPDIEPSQHAEFAEIINSAGNSLLSIISDIMDFAKIEAGQLVIKKEPFSLNDFLQSIKNEFAIKAQKKNLILKLEIFGAENIVINSDAIRLRQIFNNLLSNAIKFTLEGNIEFGAHVSDASVKFYVKDTGIGIAPEFQELIFERFRQIESSHTRKYGGNGLGLSISKSLVKLLGGNIYVDSKPGNGAIFYFVIPNGQ